jgi:SAM-dependent methyltransferase
MFATKSLDLGSGVKPKNPFNATEVYGIDIREEVPNAIFKADLAIDAIPFSSESFDYVTAFDFLEHIPRLLYNPKRNHPFVNLMNEIYRILRVSESGGLFYSKTPCYPFGDAWRDPTHVNIISDETFPLYFDNKNRWASMYGFVGAFEVVEQKINGHHLEALLKKVPENVILSKTIYD